MTPCHSAPVGVRGRSSVRYAGQLAVKTHLFVRRIKDTGRRVDLSIVYIQIYFPSWRP
jgi:hypothetical protein